MGLLHILILQFTWRAGAGVGVFTDIGLPPDDLYQPGDLVLGGLFPLNRRKFESLCGGRISSRTIQGVQGMIYMIDQINRDPTLLPNVTLGYVILNDCNLEMAALARSTQFVPLSREFEDNCRPKAGNGTSSDGFNVIGNAALENTMTEPPPPPAFRQYKVVGVVGPYSSTFSEVVSPLLSFYHIPHISWTAKSDQMTDKERYPYFSRVVPADRFQAKAIIDIIVHFNWTYFSALYSQGNYGTVGIKNIYEGAAEKGMCLAYKRELMRNFLDSDYDQVIQSLRANYRAKVVVLFLEGPDTHKVMKAVDRAQARGEFIFIGSDSFNPNAMKNMEHLAINIFSLIIPGGPFMNVPWGDPGFARYYRSLNPWNNATGSKWYGEYIPDYVKCSWEGTVNNSNWCGRLTNVTDFPGFKITDWPVRVMDCVKTFAIALNTTIRDNCPMAFSGEPLQSTCIKGETLQENIRKVEFLGYSVKVKFNNEGDLIGSRYMLVSHQYTKNKTYQFQGIGMWDYESRNLTIDARKLAWFDMVNGSAVEVSDIPKSVCSEPCRPGQFQIQGELTCCWECRPCPPDQVVTEDGKDCRPCEKTTWPDQLNFTICLPIPPTFLQWTDTITIGLLSLSFVAFILVGIIAIVFILKKDKKIIKGSSRELMAPILIGLFMAYITVIIFIKEPTKWSCYASYYGFHFSSSLIFVPLFLKTFRIYQIFRDSEKCRQRIRFVGTRTVLSMLLTFLVFQVAVTVIAVSFFPFKASLSMPVPRMAYVELSCQSASRSTLLLPLAFNLLFILLSAIFGFLTRKVPDNFNESWYIFISVTTTLIIWVAFLPTYFMTFYAYHQAALLALALILNGVVTSLCLFGPKVYAVYFVQENLIRISNFNPKSMQRSTDTTTTKDQAQTGTRN